MGTGTVGKDFMPPKKRSSRMFAGGAGEETLCKLENDLQRKLRSAWSTTSEERVANADITGGGKAQWAKTATWSRARDGAYTGARGIGDEVRQIRVRKIRVVQDVEELGPELQRNSLGQQRVLEDGQIDFLERRRSQSVAAEVAKVARAREAVAVAGRRYWRVWRVGDGKRCRITECARHLERGQVKEIERAFSIPDWADYIRTVKSFA